MHLLIDWGNTRLKALLVKNLNSVITHPAELSAVSLKSSEALIEWLSEQSIGAVQCVLIASVRAEQQTEQLIQLLKPFSQSFFAAVTSDVTAGVHCAYKNPSKLGIDRWLGLIAGFSKHHSTAIIDIGSAITLDVVDSHGQHLGGHIIPGAKLIKQSLNQTGKVFAETREAKEIGFQLGTTTGECVDFGIQQLIEGYLSGVVFELANRFQVKKWIFTGGGGLFWKKRLLSENQVITHENSNFLANIVFSGLVIDFLEKTDKA